jgi:hypothetical protein
MTREGGGPSWAASVAFESEMEPEMVPEMEMEGA